MKTKMKDIINKDIIRYLITIEDKYLATIYKYIKDIFKFTYEKINLSKKSDFLKEDGMSSTNIFIVVNN